MTVSREDYHANRALGSTDVKTLLESPALYANPAPRLETDAMRFGTAVHAMILEPERLHELVVTEAIDGRTKAGKEAIARATASGAVRLNNKQIEIFNALTEAWNRYTGTAKELLANAQTEVPMLAETLMPDGTPYVGARIQIKALLDAWSPESHQVYDIKTMTDLPTEQAMEYACRKYKWYVQAGHYSYVYEAVTGHRLDRFAFIGVQSCEPFGVSVAWVSPELLAFGRKKAVDAYGTFLDCQNWNDWPTGAPEQQTLALPRYLD